MDSYIKAMFGCYAMHVPINLIVQEGDTQNKLVMLCGQSCVVDAPNPLRFGSKLTHQLIMGDCIIRPHAIIESNAFRGHGISALMTMSPTDWIENEHKILLDQMGDAEARLYGRKYYENMMKHKSIPIT